MINLASLFQKVFNFTGRPITEADSPETIPGWDSFQSLILFQELERVSGVSFRIDDLKNIRTVKDICALLDRYTVAYRL